MTDAEVVTLTVAQAMMDIPSDREFLAVAGRRSRGLLPQQPGYWERRLRLSETIEWLTAMFAHDSPGYFEDVVLVDSTPVECGCSVDTTRRSALAEACAHHYSRSTAAGFGACNCICWPRPTARHAPRSWPPPIRRNAR